MSSCLFISISLLLSLPSYLALRTQTVAIKGVLLCGSQPLANTTVKLWDEDTGPDPDDLLAQGTTDSEGRFQLSGTETELTDIDPRFKVYHNCDNKLLSAVQSPCKRKVTFTIPDKYINAGQQVGRVFDIGVLNMETIFEKEDTQCF